MIKKTGYYFDTSLGSKTVNPYTQFYNTEKAARSAIIQRELKWRHFKNERGDLVSWSKLSEEQKSTILLDFEIIPITLTIERKL